MNNASIASWNADSECLEVGVWIEPWGKFARYRKLYVNGAGTYAMVWKWVEGAKDSTSKSWANAELQEILDELVLSHEVLSLFCSNYGIVLEEVV